MDYHPNKPLAEACSQIGIDPAVFPCKTCSVIEKNGDEYIPRVSAGYKAPWVEITEELINE